MSSWTQIVATLDVDTHIYHKNIKEKVEEMLINAPEITGSERSADIFVNTLSGYNVFIGCDCSLCEYKDTVIRHEQVGFICDADESYICPDGEYQTRVVIAIVGSLRDRLKEQTKEEYTQFIKYIKNRCGFYIRNQTVKIHD